MGAELVVVISIILIICLVLVYLHYYSNNYLRVKFFTGVNYQGDSGSIYVKDMPVGLIIYFDGATKLDTSPRTRSIELPLTFLKHPKSFSLQGDFYKNIRRIDVKLKNTNITLVKLTELSRNYQNFDDNQIEYVRFYFK